MAHLAYYFIGLRPLKIILVSILLLGSAASWSAPIILGSKNFTEQHVLSAMTVQYLQKKGFQVVAKTDLSTMILRNALLNKQIDMNWEYTGTSLIIFNHINQRMTSSQAYETVKQLDAKQGLIWLKPSVMNNTYAFAMRRQTAEKYQIKTLSDLARKIEKIQQQDPDNNWLLAFDIEFVGRSDGLKPMQKLYNMPLERPQIRQMDAGLVYNAIRDGFVQAGLVFTTDGRVKGFDFLLLEDDKGYFPSYTITPVVRDEVLKQNPGLEDALNTLSSYLSNDVIAELNAKVDIEHQSARQVAQQFLQEQGLI